jgi:hypothetical protein
VREVRTKNSLYLFIKGQIHFAMPRGAKMSFTLMNPKQVTLHSNSNTTSEDAAHV